MSAVIKDEFTKILAENSPEAHVSVHVVSCQARERVARVYVINVL